MKYTRKNRLRKSIKKRRYRKQKGGNNLKVIYLINTDKGLPEIYNCIKDKSIVLSFKEETPDTKIFLPNSKWTDARNKLREYAMNLPEKYDYYVFMDNDITFKDLSQEEGFKKFEEQLLLKKPKIATPILSPYNYYCLNNLIFDLNPETCDISNIKKVIWYDAIMNAFSKDIFFENKIFPYDNKYDITAWAISQYILIIKSYYYYNNEVILFNDLVIKSNSSGTYAKNTSKELFDDAYNYTLKTIPNELQNKYITNQK
jgi:hypothetical protein